MPNDGGWKFTTTRDDPTYTDNPLIRFVRADIVLKDAARALATLREVFDDPKRYAQRTCIDALYASASKFDRLQLREWSSHQIVHLTLYLME